MENFGRCPEVPSVELRDIALGQPAFGQPAFGQHGFGQARPFGTPVVLSTPLKPKVVADLLGSQAIMHLEVEIT
ncbi:23037_t:CDS:2, partial [Gigaspora margarita]